MAQKDSGYKRVKHDAYQTPEWATEAVIPHLPISVYYGVISEPAAGDGQMVVVLRRHKFKVIGSDIKRGRDFLAMDKKGEPVIKNLKTVLTNPPFNLADKFIERALASTKKEKGVVALLLRVDFDSAVTRRKVFADHPAFVKKVVLTKRIQWFKPRRKRDKNGKLKKASGPSENHAWFIWDWRNTKPPTIGYAP